MFSHNGCFPRAPCIVSIICSKNSDNEHHLDTVDLGAKLCSNNKCKSQAGQIEWFRGFWAVWSFADAEVGMGCVWIVRGWLRPRPQMACFANCRALTTPQAHHEECSPNACWWCWTESELGRRQRSRYLLTQLPLEKWFPNPLHGSWEKCGRQKKLKSLSRSPAQKIARKSSVRRISECTPPPSRMCRAVR